MITNILLYNIITRKHDFCCLCFKTIEENPVTIEDEIILKENIRDHTIKMRDILTLVLGYETMNNLLAFEVLCKQCMQTAVNSYQFIMMARKNSERISNVLCSLNTCLENTTTNMNTSKSLFVTIDCNNFVSQSYYDQKSSSSSSVALKRLKHMLDTKSNLKRETKLIKMEKENPDTTLKKRRKYFSVPIKTRDMLYNESDSTNLKCKECMKMFLKLSTLRNHYIRVHAPKDHKCNICYRKFGSIALLEAHKSSSHCTIVCSECGKTFHNRHTLRMHEIGHRHFRLVCQDCGRVYRSQSSFKKHIDLNICGQKTRASPADAKFTCDYCNKKYTQKVSLRVHIQYVHGNYKSHECKWCKKKFYAQSRLKAHIVKHTQEKNFPCNMCGGKFITKESLLYHTRTHTGEKPYKCEHCDRRFVSISRRTEHIKHHHPDLVLVKFLT